MTDLPEESMDGGFPANYQQVYGFTCVLRHGMAGTAEIRCGPNLS